MDVLTSSRRFFTFPIKILISFSLLAIVFSMVDFSIIKQASIEANPWGLIGACVILIISHFFGQYCWIYIVKAQNQRARVGDLISSYWKGLFFNNVLPTNIGGDLVKGVDIIRRYGNKYFYITTILLDRVINFAILLWLGGVAFCLYFERHKTLLFVMGSTAFLAICVGIGYRLALYRIICQARKQPRKSPLYRIAKSSMILKSIIEKKKILFLVLFFAFCSQFLKIYIAYINARSMGFELPLEAAFIAVCVYALLGLVPFSIGGLGIREYGTTMLDGLAGLEMTQYFLLSVLGHVDLILSSLPGLIILFSFGKNGASQIPGTKGK